MPSISTQPQALLVSDNIAAGMTGISRSHWQRLRAAGKVPPSVRLGRKVLWRRDEIADWIDAGCPDACTWAQMTAKDRRGKQKNRLTSSSRNRNDSISGAGQSTRKGQGQMAEIFRPIYTSTDSVTGEKVRKKSPTWWIRYYTPDGRRHKVKGYRDRKATENKAAELERRGMRVDAGLTDPAEEHAKRPLADHLQDYRAFMTAKGNTGKHAELTETRVQTCLDSCHFIRMPDLQPSAVVGFLADLRVQGKSIATANHYLTAVKGFTRWLWRERRISADPLAGLAKLANGETDIRHARRDLTADECSFFLASVQASDRAFRYLSGLDRFALYMTAAGTGLRASELASLTPASFCLEEAPPMVRLQAAYAKNRKQAELPLPGELADLLRGYLASKPADAPVWPGTWSNAASAKMIRLDLSDTRKQWLAGFQDARQRAEAERSDFLAYVDA